MASYNWSNWIVSVDVGGPVFATFPVYAADAPSAMARSVPISMANVWRPVSARPETAEEARERSLLRSLLHNFHND